MPDQNRTTTPNSPPPSWSSHWEETPDTDRDAKKRAPEDTPLGKAHAAMPGYEASSYDKPEEEEVDEEADTQAAAAEDEEQPKEGGEAQPNEGEGNRTAARRYAKGVQRTIQQGDVDEHAEEAARALDGPEGESLRRAEQQAKRGPAVSSPKH